MYRDPSSDLAGEPGAVGPSHAPTYAAAWDRAFGHLDGEALLEAMITRVFPERIALVSSFGAEAAVLLDMVARIDRSVPVLFLDTGKHFDATLTYRDILVRRFGLTDVRSLRPDPADLRHVDPDGNLHRHDPDMCCHIRKVAPLERALGGFDAWITGRKRFQGTDRSKIEPVEVADNRVKINPLAGWTAARIDEAFRHRGLPRHPLFDDGFLSIGCEPCTRRVRDGEDSRSGRWAGFGKTECGIHLPGDASPAPR
jgi:phosphoadenosine phosphosulfate reductase